MVVQRHSEMVPGELILKTHAEQGVFWVLGGAERGQGAGQGFQVVKRTGQGHCGV